MTRSLALAPRSGMLPPQGCRGAVSGWPRLMLGIAEGGSPMQLMAALSGDGMLLTHERPPVDIYGSFVWLVTRIWIAAETIAVTLGPATVPAGLALQCEAIAQEAAALAERVDHLRWAIGYGPDAASVLTNLFGVLQSTATEWHAFSGTLAEARLEALDIRSAAESWSHYANAIRTYAGGLLLAD